MTGENGYPETPEWSPEPHPYVRVTPPLVMPDCELGEN